jgi:hypothetical protein
MKRIYKVRTNNGCDIFVKAEQDELEKLFMANKIEEYTLAHIYTLKDIAD